MKRNFKALYLQVPFQPWIYFLFFLLANCFLSFVSLSWTVRLMVELFGLALPSGLALWSVLEQRLKKDGFSLPLADHRLQGPPAWFWCLGGAGLLFTRFFRLTSSPFWLINDEGSFGILGMKVMHHFDWHLLWTDGRIEPLLIWSLGLFFRLVPPSLFAIRLFPALWTLATVGLAYWAARRYFDRPLAAIFTWLLAFSFWEFSLMRFCTPEDLIPFFQVLALGCLGTYAGAKSIPSRMGWMMGLIGANVGGFYSYVNWAPIWFFITLLLGFRALERGKEERFYFLLFQSSNFILLLPLILARCSPEGMSYINVCWNGSSLGPSLLSYISGLFWNGRASYPFSPDWGGMLDPLTASLALVGTLGAIGKLKKWEWLWLGLGLGSALLPGLLTGHLELHRVTPSLPFWIFLASLGALELLQILPRKHFWSTFTVLGSLVLSLNLYNFIGPYDDIARARDLRQWRSLQYVDAFSTLDALGHRTGPFYLFSEFNTDYFNKTLNVTAYPFNVLQNPDLSRQDAHWAALVLNQNYAPFLKEEFHGAIFKILKADQGAPKDTPPFGLLLIPISEIPQNKLDHWIKADEICRQADERIHDRTLLDPWDNFLGMYSKMLLLGSDDRLLKAVYWEKLGFFKFLEKDFPSAIGAYQRAIHEGFPAAHLYYDLGVCFRFLGDKPKSLAAFQEAQRKIR